MAPKCVRPKLWRVKIVFNIVDTQNSSYETQNASYEIQTDSEKVILLLEYAVVLRQIN